MAFATDDVLLQACVNYGMGSHCFSQSKTLITYWIHRPHFKGVKTIQHTIENLHVILL